MQYLDGRTVYSATDLNNFLECRRLTELEALVARALLVRPADEDEQSKLVRRKGEEHEVRYLERLRAAIPGLVTFERTPRSIAAYEAAAANTLAAMRDGAPVIYQATLFDGTFLGHADFLRRVDHPSALGAWSYEVLDTKLALSSKPYFLVQLCNYSEHLERIQGVAPRFGHIILGDGVEQSFLLNDFMAYYRHLKSSFFTFVETASRREAAAEYPLPREHCNYCPWDAQCKAKRKQDDHLSLVAWMRRDQIAKFEAVGIETAAQLAAAEDDARPSGMNPETFVKLRRQARLQVQARDGQRYVERLAHDPKLGFGLLPEPNEGDVFFDMEGDPLYEPGRSLEYLFGAWTHDDPNFRAFWGLNRDEEKRAFEAFVDFVVARRTQYPAMHVYHYAPYEKTALRRLAQAHGTREDEVDDLLRAEVLVDLYAVVRQAIAISEDSYSIKRLEKFYGLDRHTNVKKGDASIVMFEQWLIERDDAILRDIEAYNRDDCRSTLMLRDWLIEQRTLAEREQGTSYPAREFKTAERPQRDDDLEARSNALQQHLLSDLPSIDETTFSALDERVRLRYLLGNALAYHRREEKPVWWAFFDRCDNVDDLREFDREAIGGLQYLSEIEPRREKKSWIYTYRIPEQRFKLGSGDAVVDPVSRENAGSIFAIDDANGMLELKWTGDQSRARALTALIPGHPPSTGVQRKAVARLAQSWVDGTFEREHPAAADMLALRPPRLRGTLPGMTIQPDRVDAAAVSALVRALDSSYLFIQGPPGSGKTTTSAQVIADLLADGKRVGVVSTGHKAIHHLLHKVEDAMRRRGKRFRGLYKYNADKPHSEYRSQLHDPCIVSTTKNADFDAADFDLAGGTAWLFSRSELCGTFDYLFIDEAGQVSLADALAVAGCSRNVVLLGDPAQLAQVSQGTHPYRAGWSVLEHLLGDEPTIPPERGVFLDVSYRMHPEICAFISHAVYDGRLNAGPQTEHHRIESPGISGSGLRYLAIEHSGNDASSAEEADRIVTEIALLREGTVADDDGLERALEDRDIIVVTPYNAQRKLIERRLRDAGFDVAVGTVDKFQGQEAAVVFYSMATSSGEDVPRDLAFLFEQNRFNVAVSRARALSVLVCSPKLLDVNCSNPQQMAMINFLCAYVEKSTLPPRPGVSAAASADFTSLSG